jgi:uncharacterized protein YbgA (DUF1722 family)/uncharacterized protein YbbK (DUF523 family)
VGISSCLLGQAVRYDGGHKRDLFLIDVLGPLVEWVPVCPEMEAGFGTPREPMRLVRRGEDIRLLTVTTKRDATAQMHEAIAGRMHALAGQDLSGYVLKRNSPSCGAQGVTLYDEDGVPVGTGEGMFASALGERFPLLPIEEEDRLSDPQVSGNFLERVVGCWQLRGFFREGWTVAELVRFHTAHKLILMSHAPKACTALGRVTADAKTCGRIETERRYSNGFTRTLAIMTSAGSHTNVLQHMAGYFSEQLDKDARDELHARIDDYRRGVLPLSVPLTMIRQHVRALDVAYLADQLYLAPHPSELMLRRDK